MTTIPTQLRPIKSFVKNRLNSYIKKEGLDKKNANLQSTIDTYFDVIFHSPPIRKN